MEVLRSVAETVIVHGKKYKIISRRFAETTNPHKNSAEECQSPGPRNSPAHGAILFLRPARRNTEPQKRSARACVGQRLGRRLVRQQQVILIHIIRMNIIIPNTRNTNKNNNTNNSSIARRGGRTYSRRIRRLAHGHIPRLQSGRSVVGEDTI